MENFKDVFLFTISDAHLFGYIVAFLAALLETVFAVGLFLPGSTMILFLGVLAAQ
ncbi:MAG TPA: DedA family protein, partial [Candidatus Moranbacteria bacterium]|nr:DedA family protein [Candidatus Moranbacteria bacterium]